MYKYVVVDWFSSLTLQI